MNYRNSMSNIHFDGTELCLVLKPSAKQAIVDLYSIQLLHNTAGGRLWTPTAAEARGAEGSSFQGKCKSPSTLIKATFIKAISRTSLGLLLQLI